MEPAVGLIAFRDQTEVVAVEGEPFTVFEGLMFNAAKEAKCGLHLQARLLLKLSAGRISKGLTWINSAAGHLEWHVRKVGFINTSNPRAEVA
jgi:hypothetical protein